MQERNDITSFDAILDAKYGAVGTAEREAFRKEAKKLICKKSTFA